MASLGGGAPERSAVASLGALPWEATLTCVSTVIEIPDELYAEAERLTRRLGSSVAELYSDALREDLARHDPDAVTPALDRMGDVLASALPAPPLSAAASRLLERVAW